MAQDDILNTEAHQQLDERIRDIELNQATINSTVQSINANIGDMKVMFQKFTHDSEKIASKTDAIFRVEKESSALGQKVDGMYEKLILVEHTCKTCSISRVNDYIGSMSEKINKIEVSVDEIKKEKTKFNGFWNNITQTIVTIVILYMLYIIATNIKTNGNIIANPPDIEKKSDNTLFINDAQAGTIQGKYSSVKIGRKEDVKN